MLNAKTFVVLTLTIFTCASCTKEMAHQEKYKALQSNDLFADSRSARPLLKGTVPHGTDGVLSKDELIFKGTLDGEPANIFPFKVTYDSLLRGQERFNIHCSPCHDRAGTGNGLVVQRGFTQPPSLHIDRLRQAPLGHFFQVITNGFGRMPSYALQINAQDRWNIIAYIRALQLSQSSELEKLPSELQNKFKMEGAQ
ncbi:MAG: c-type cytochrome [Pseudobdellovibrionaceae bacterium]